MDPNEALKNLREAARDNLAHAEEFKDRPGELLVMIYEAAESFQALDEWLSKGGFLPADWQRDRH